MAVSPEAYAVLVDLASKGRQMIVRLAQTGSGNYQAAVEIYQQAWNDAEPAISEVSAASFIELVEDGKYGPKTASTLAQLLPASAPPPTHAYQMTTWYAQYKDVVDAMGSYEETPPDTSMAFEPPAMDGSEYAPDRDWAPAQVEPTGEVYGEPIPAGYVPPVVITDFAPPEADEITLPSDEETAVTGPLVTEDIPAPISMSAEVPGLEEEYASDPSMVQNAPGSPVVVLEGGEPPITAPAATTPAVIGVGEAVYDPTYEGPELEVIGRRKAPSLMPVAAIAGTVITGGFLWWMLGRKGPKRRRAHA